MRLVFATFEVAPHGGGKCEARRLAMVMNEAKDQVSLDADVDMPVV